MSNSKPLRVAGTIALFGMTLLFFALISMPVGVAGERGVPIQADARHGSVVEPGARVLGPVARISEKAPF